MLIQLSSAMGYIHSRRLVHRDINPAIIHIRQEGPEENQTTLKIADFGMNYMYIDTKTCEVSFWMTFELVYQVLHELHEKCAIQTVEHKDTKHQRSLMPRGTITTVCAQ